LGALEQLQHPRLYDQFEHIDLGVAVSTLYLVATPIGNLGDISNRALQVLGEVRLIAAEDTRRTIKLLNHYGIHTPISSYHEHNKITKLTEFMAALEAGDVALVSDAGTPALNDPGYELVRAALVARHSVTPVPGPCAPIAALVASGLPTEAFLYLGYLPRKITERRHLLVETVDLPYTLIFLETPHRLLSALEDLKIVLGDRNVAVARELTKLHEEIFRGSLSAAWAHFATQPPRGEFVLVVAGRAPQQEAWSAERLRAVLKEHLERGASPAQIAGDLAARSGWARREVYQVINELKGKLLKEL
jgi:16S rRNA (cytidine1402-2'-O)-methyltransferase